MESPGSNPPNLADPVELEAYLARALELLWIGRQGAAASVRRASQWMDGAFAVSMFAVLFASGLTWMLPMMVLIAMYQGVRRLARARFAERAQRRISLMQQEQPLLLRAAACMFDWLTHDPSVEGFVDFAEATRRSALPVRIVGCVTMDDVLELAAQLRGGEDPALDRVASGIRRRLRDSTNRTPTPHDRRRSTLTDEMVWVDDGSRVFCLVLIPSAEGDLSVRDWHPAAGMTDVWLRTANRSPLDLARDLDCIRRVARTTPTLSCAETEVDPAVHSLLESRFETVRYGVTPRQALDLDPADASHELESELPDTPVVQAPARAEEEAEVAKLRLL